MKKYLLILLVFSIFACKNSPTDPNLIAKDNLANSKKTSMSSEYSLNEKYELSQKKVELSSTQYYLCYEVVDKKAKHYILGFDGLKANWYKSGQERNVDGRAKLYRTVTFASDKELCDTFQFVEEDDKRGRGPKKVGLNILDSMENKIAYLSIDQSDNISSDKESLENYLNK